MKFGMFKTGKEKETKSGGAQAAQIAGLEEQLNGRTNNLKQTEAQLKKLSGKGKNGKDNDAAKPHSPIGELTVEPEAKQAEEVLAAEGASGAPAVSVSDGIKMVEVKVNPNATPEKEGKGDASGSSFSSLFAHDDEEENPMAALIRSLPEVDTNELMEDLKEIKDIIKDWQKK